MGGALIGARLAGFATFEAVGVLRGVPGAVRFAFATELRAELAKAGVLFRSSDHRCGSGAADVGAVEARERAFDHFRSRVADVFSRAFIAGHRAEHACLNGTLHILFGFFAHSCRVVVFVEFRVGGEKSCA